MASSGRGGNVVVLGSINMDLVTTVSRLPHAGETLLGNEFTTIPGGKGANQAIAAARAGGRVEFLGAVGDDDFADRLTDALVAGTVSVELLRRVEGASGIAAITVDDGAENTIVVVAGANGTVTVLDDAELRAVRSAGILVSQLEIPIDAVVQGAAAAADAGVPVLLNPSPVRPLPADLIGAVTILVVNEGEASALGARVLRQVPHVVTTLGAGGARYTGEHGDFTVPAPMVRPVDTTGAGDAFTGALAVAWLGGADARQAVQRACAAGALSTTRRGAGSSAPVRAEIDELVASTYRA